MTYDYHGYWDGPLLDKRTGHNSPLYALPSEEDPADLWHGLNTDFSMKYWVAGGARKDQLLMGEWLSWLLLIYKMLVLYTRFCNLLSESSTALLHSQ